MFQLEQVEEFESSYKLTWGVKNDGKKVVIDTPADEEKCSTVKLKASCQAWWVDSPLYPASDNLYRMFLDDFSVNSQPIFTWRLP